MSKFSFATCGRAWRWLLSQISPERIDAHLAFLRDLQPRHPATGEVRGEVRASGVPT